MAEAHCRDQWDHTAMILTKLHNVNCSRRSDMIRDPATFNPYTQRDRRKKQPAAGKLTVRDLAAVLCNGQLPAASKARD